MPISSIGRLWSADLWNPKYASHVYKVTVAIDMVATFYGFALWSPGHQLIFFWDGYGPSHTRGHFFDFEVGGHDGAYKGGTLSAVRAQCNYLGVWPYWSPML